ncbi:CGNR zinc finger domain-containing protein [Micromonospora sp. URMC 106]|uniref:CGNR zinc finger domain-containing protein n=1 Tax=Micromonospora sp. URMC 106 TaxID=3423408 RepID=UPI003F1DB935
MAMFKAGAEAAVRRCADVINAADTDDGDMRAALEAHGETVSSFTPDEARRLRDAAARLRAVARAGSLDEACARLNDVLADCRPPRLTAHEGTPWHLHVDSGDAADWAEWFTASSALALAILAAETQQPPLGVCQAPGCDRVFPTHSPGRPRRYCSATCSSRARVASHRSRV